MLSVVMLSIVMLSIVMLKVVILSVGATLTGDSTWVGPCLAYKY